MSRDAVLLAGWTVLAGIGIPLVGVLNSGMARSVGNPLSATAVMFAVALCLAAVLAVPIHGIPSLGELRGAAVSSYMPGLLIAFYALSATIIIPRFGTGNFVTFILLAQLVTAATVDQFGLMGMARRPADAVRLAGLALVVAGIVLIQMAGQREAGK